jgi:hypothetical protein
MLSNGSTLCLHPGICNLALYLQQRCMKSHQVVCRGVTSQPMQQAVLVPGNN